MVQLHNIWVLTNTAFGLELKPQDLAVLYYSPQNGNKISVLNTIFLLSLMYLPTRSKFPLYFDTVGAALCRHNVIVDGVCSKFLGDGNCSRSTQGGGGIPE